MDHILYVFYLVVVALTVLLNRGNGDRVHYVVQLYLTVFTLFCSLGALNWI